MLFPETLFSRSTKIALHARPPGVFLEDHGRLELCLQDGVPRSLTLLQFHAAADSINQTQKQVRLVGYRVDHKNYWIATDRFDLSAEQIAAIYKERWLIENFFAWWKRHLKVYHIIARSRYGLTMQILAGLITCLLLAIYCQNHFGERVSIKRVRRLRIQIRNELQGIKIASEGSQDFKEQKEQEVIP